MIVDPDFMDHWRTGMVIDALQDPLAPIYILRLWAHCQERRSDTFIMPTRGLKAQCKCPGDAETFEAALIEAGFIKRDGDTITVLGWAEKNAALFAAWENGAKGGRPRKEPKQNPDETHGLPMANPSLTQTKPIREEKSREEEIPPSLRSGEGTRKRVARPPDVSEQVWRDWNELRRKKRAAVTETAVDGAREEAAKAGMTLQQFLVVWCRRGSQGLEAEWLKPHERSQGPPKSFAQSDADAKAARIAEMTGGILGKKPTIEVFDVTPTAIR